MTDHQRPNSLLSLARRDTYNLLLVVVVLALGTGSATAALGLIFSERPLVLLGGSFFVVICGLLVAFRNLLPNRQFIRNFEGVICVGENNEPKAIERYHFSETLLRYVKALHVENKAIAARWTESKFYEFDEGEVRERPSAALAREALEYYILDRLSSKLTDYFNNEPHVDKAKIQTLQRQDIPSFLFSNRFLDLFSRPMEDREPFGTDFDPLTRGEVVYAISKDAIFSRFEMTLPKDAEISRSRSGQIDIKFRAIHISFLPEFEGFGFNLPRHFERHYMKAEPKYLKSYKASLTLTVRFSWRSFLTPGGWQYFRWLDSFVDQLEREFDFDVFLRTIAWDQALTTLILLAKNKRQEKTNTEDGSGEEIDPQISAIQVVKVAGPEND